MLTQRIKFTWQQNNSKFEYDNYFQLRENMQI